MSAPTYVEVLRLAEQLTPNEQRALAARLQESAARLTLEERLARFRALPVHTNEPSPDFSLNRADWYDDDGR